ncbi:DUF3383 domain-containing protein [Paenibacillus alvei]|uniref:DUF3383 domain-containing protein n=1 Tax=Paenibacillus alvei TaxID=44250 RepID=A0ABT4GQK7_PAEAL|nr:DUF3383 family protein [Paenibacillus alvei]MCY9758973.1 DUF3383 domain-containing protein [Paenibacillus alvei]MCY9770646.1 DUF3383 domain-containing protein [Paenibacillus alvei]
MRHLGTLKDVTVTIDLVQPTGRLGFGTPLIYGSKAKGHELKYYYELSEVQKDFSDKTPEYEAAKVIFEQEDKRPEKIAIACRDAAIKDVLITDALETLLDKDWYFLICTSALKEDVLKISEMVELDGSKMYFTRTDKVEDAAEIKKAGKERTVVFYHKEVNKYPEAGLIGAVGAAPVGSVTWKFKEIKGIMPMEFSTGELTAVHDAGAITYVQKAGRAGTSEGTTSTGVYIDIIHSKDYVKFNMEYRLQQLLNNTPKIPYTDAGIALIEAQCTNVLKEAFNNGIIAADENGIPLYSVNFKKRSEIPADIRAKREYNEGSFEFELSGAVHGIKIKGSIRF